MSVVIGDIVTFEDLMQTAQKLNISVEALAALAARLLADTEGISLDSEVERSLETALRLRWASPPMSSRALPPIIVAQSSE